MNKHIDDMITHLHNLDDSVLDKLENHKSFDAIIYFLIPELVAIENWNDFIHEQAENELLELIPYQTEADYQEAYETELYHVMNQYTVIEFSNLDLILNAE